jgi:hypothetical protein
MAGEENRPMEKTVIADVSDMSDTELADLLDKVHRQANPMPTRRSEFSTLLNGD